MSWKRFRNDKDQFPAFFAMSSESAVGAASRFQDTSEADSLVASANACGKPWLEPTIPLSGQWWAVGIMHAKVGSEQPGTNHQPYVQTGGQASLK